jgi:hypothetical protein
VTRSGPSLLNDEELALLLAPIDVERRGAVFRIINTGIDFGSIPPRTDVMSCEDFNGLVLLLLQDSDFDALILGGFPFTHDEFLLLLPLLNNLPQIQLFVLTPSDELLINISGPNIIQTPNIKLLNQAVIAWHRTLHTDYRDWLKTISFTASDSHCLDWQHIVFAVGGNRLIPIQELDHRTSIPVALVGVSQHNPHLVQELKILARNEPQPPMILVEQNSPYIARTCQAYCSRLGLPVLATLEASAVSNALRNLVLHYYRRYRRRRLLIKSNENCDRRYVYQQGQHLPTGQFITPENAPELDASVNRSSLQTRPIYYLTWQCIAEHTQAADFAHNFIQIKNSYELEFEQLTIVFDGDPPTEGLQEQLLELLIKSVNTCWIPRNIRMLMDSRKLFEITQVLIPISIWQELISDESFYLKWLRLQERIRHRHIKIGLLGLSHKLGPQLTNLGFDFVVE